MPFEYTTSVVTRGFMGRNAEELNRSDLESELNRMGAEGWELVHVFFDTALQREKDGHLLIFKRAVG
ncbi:MAG TPA: DUF4177 domain-containing protein [Solirubrobacteraceae bacterium]|jgi:hypothetical protein|nr:DUF4177 domain-containing protein [Solirubrobacteraceae bacterium]